MSDNLYINMKLLLYQLSMIVVSVHAGSALTSSAKDTSGIISKIMNEPFHDEPQKFELIYLMTQTRSRNLNVQNSVFIINWNVFLAVSIKICFKDNFFTDHVDYRHLFSYLLPVRAALKQSSVSSAKNSYFFHFEFHRIFQKCIFPFLFLSVVWHLSSVSQSGCLSIFCRSVGRSVCLFLCLFADRQSVDQIGGRWEGRERCKQKTFLSRLHSYHRQLHSFILQSSKRLNMHELWGDQSR